MKHTSYDLRNMGVVALRKLGGVEYLMQVGREHPPAFMRFLSKCMPREMVHEAGPTLLDALKQAAQRRSTIDVTPRAVEAIEVIDHDRPA